MQSVTEGRFLWRTTPEVAYLEPAELGGHARVRCAFTLRQAGAFGRTLNLSFDRGQRADVLANRQRVLQALGLGHTTLYTVRQVHGNQVCVVDKQAVQRGLHGVEADALVTALPEVPLGILVADCLPIVLYALKPLTLAVVHAGRMGTYQRIVCKVLEVLHHHFAVAPEQVHAVLGPTIGACCYTLDARAVGPFQQRFPDWEQFFTPHGNNCWTMSLTAANTAQLHAAGVPAGQLRTAHICTACYNKYLYSHRAEGQKAGRCMGIAALLPPAVDEARNVA
ncbi:MAG TPA: polyphenol oxidase family protein [Candidatus Tectomicrobia bacterium]